MSDIQLNYVERGAGDALISSFRKKYRQVEAECDAD